MVELHSSIFSEDELADMTLELAEERIELAAENLSFLFRQLQNRKMIGLRGFDVGQMALANAIALLRGSWHGKR